MSRAVAHGVKICKETMVPTGGGWSLRAWVRDLPGTRVSEDEVVRAHELAGLRVPDRGSEAWKRAVHDLEEGVRFVAAVRAVFDAAKSFGIGGSSTPVTIHPELAPPDGRRMLYRSFKRSPPWSTNSPEEASSIAQSILNTSLLTHPAISCSLLSVSPTFSTHNNTNTPSSARFQFFCDRKARGASLIATRNLDSSVNIRALSASDVAYLPNLPYSSTTKLSSEELVPFLSKLGFSTNINTLISVLNTVYLKIFKDKEAISTEFCLSLDSQGSYTIDDPYFYFDPFSLVRQPELQRLCNPDSQDPAETAAAEHGLFYIKLAGNGNIGCFGYGAGVGMQICDAISHAGGKPANFLDGGGGANRTNARQGLLTLAQDPEVKAVFINIFGGITRTDIVAQGLIDAMRENIRLSSGQIPVVARIRGTNSDEANRLLNESEFEIHTLAHFEDAVDTVVKMARNL